MNRPGRQEKERDPVRAILGRVEERVGLAGEGCSGGPVPHRDEVVERGARPVGTRLESLAGRFGPVFKDGGQLERQ